MGGGNDYLDSNASFGGEETASGSYLHGGFGTDGMYLSVNQNHIGINLEDYTDGFKLTNKAILNEQGTSSNIGSVDDSYFEEFENIYTYAGEDTFYIAGATDDLSYIYAGIDNDFR